MTTLSRCAPFVELTKPRIVLLELVAVLVTLHVATRYGAPGTAWSLSLLLGVSLGTLLVAGSANAINQWIERELDARMRRTRTRPIPSGRLTPADALAFGVLTLAMGVSTLGMTAGPEAAVVAFVTWVVYVAVYTPMKTKTWLNTAVGAVSGALPLGIGWTAGGGRLDDPLSLALLGVMYVWQFPHFMAIAWLCRDDYQVAGYRMSTTLDPSGLSAGWQALTGSAVLLPLSLAPLFVSDSIRGWVYAAPVVSGGLLMLVTSSAFLADRSDATARRLMRASLVYVPMWLAGLWLSGV
ncbi:MAG: heme o synthase [Lacipirellulaceae bacterium]